MRERKFLLAEPEARVLEWIAGRLPSWVKPDHLTAVGVLASVAIAAAYVLSNGDKLWLWAASALLVVHWLGDSLDGTLARVRKSERPRYGYYLDHLVDAFATAAIGIGLGGGFSYTVYGPLFVGAEARIRYAAGNYEYTLINGREKGFDRASVEGFNLSGLDAFLAFGARLP